MTLSTFLVLATDRAPLCHCIAPNILHLCHTTLLPHTSTPRANLSIDYRIHVSVRLMGCPYIAKIFSGIQPLAGCQLVSIIQFFIALPSVQDSRYPKLDSQCPEVHTSYMMWHSLPYLFTSTSAALILMWILISCATPLNAPSSRHTCLARRWYARFYTIMSAFLPTTCSTIAKGVWHMTHPQ